MKKAIQLMLLLTSISFAQVVTPNTGITWNLDSLVAKSGGKVTGAFPNYQVNDSVRVQANDKLVIAAGSNVTFTTKGSCLDIQGALQVNGTASSKVTLVGATADSTGAFQGITFEDSSIDSLCYIKYANISYAYYGLRAINASPTIQNSYLFKCDRGIQMTGSNAIIRSNKIERSFEYGISLTLSSNPIIDGNEICNNNTQNTSAKNQINIGLQGNNSPIITNNKIYGSTNTKTGGIGLWVYGSGAYSNIVIDGNTIYNNAFGLTLYGAGGGIINGVVSNNVIYNNNINPDVMTTGSGINVNGGTAVQPVIKRNVIYGNWWGITIQNGASVTAGPQPKLGDLTNADTSDNGYNKIYNNIQGTYVYDLYNNCTNDVMAQNNDWGVYDSLSIEQHIFHKADDSTHGKVYFMPFYKPTVIPVELVSFAAGQVNGAVVLKWTTATETNNSGFEIQRALGTNDYKKIAFVGGQGNSTVSKAYEYRDSQIPAQAQNVKYRLKQVDYNGSYEYSNTAEVSYSAPRKYSLEQNYPNPFNPSTLINFNLANAGKVTLKVYNVLGKEIATLVNKEMPAGSHSVKFDAGNLSSGFYFYTINAGNFTSTKKMILIK